MNYFGNLVLTSASYLPVPGAEVLSQGRDFAVAKLPVDGARTVCSIASYVFFSKFITIDITLKCCLIFFCG